MNSPHLRRDERKLGDRSVFAREWLEDAKRHQKEQRVFSAFFSAYIALVAASCQMAGDSGASQRYAKRSDEQFERSAIESALKYRAKHLDDFLKSDNGKKIATRLWQREVPEGEKFKIIESSNDPELEEAARLLYENWLPVSLAGKPLISPEVQAEKLGYLLRKIRNRLFHGQKMNDPNGADADLLERINPLLIGVVEVILVH